MLLLFIVLIVSSVIAEPDELDIKHIVDVITKSRAEVFSHKSPENANEFQTLNQDITEYGTFDYIIVGAGSTGAVLATRLSENDNRTILLLEAGGEETTFSQIPAMMLYLRGTRFNWNYKTVPQTTCCLGMVDERCAHPQGKGLGGTSVIDAGIYVRGNEYDFNSWAQAGNKGWSYDEVLPYFIKSENAQIDGDPGYHRKGGPLNVEYHSPTSRVTHAFIKANLELGRKFVDYNGREQLGVSDTQFTTKNGHRFSAGKAFLSTAKERKNLTILTNSYARKVVIDDSKVARGVIFDHNGKASVAKVRKEIVLSAGVFGSPHVLLLSGIGPAKELTTLNIPVVHELPVGENYRDHPTVFPLLFTTNYSEPSKTLYESSKDYLEGVGGFTTGANTQAIAFLRTESATTPRTVPNIEVLMIPQIFYNDYFQQAHNFAKSYWPKLDNQKVFGMMLSLLNPKSRGKVTLKSSNPYDYPNIDPNFLSDKANRDIGALYEGVQMIQEMLDTTAFRKIDAKMYYEVHPDCRNYVEFSKQQWMCQIRHLTMNAFHSIGTCKMAPHPSKGGVVDSQLKVHGIRKLRVADASIIPDSISGNTGAPAIMIGEKLADILKNE